MRRKILTPRQKQVLEFIKLYWKDNGYAPSYDNIKDGLGAKSKSSIAALIDRLERKGYITRIPQIARSIRVTEDGKAVTQEVAQSPETPGTEPDVPWAD